MLITPLPSLNKVFGMVIQQERQFSFEHSEHSKALANLVASDPRRFNQDRNGGNPQSRATNAANSKQG